MPQLLQSWNDGTTKQAIIDFVKRGSQPGSPDFIPPAERIAVFDNDGTLWCEKPAYIQLDYLLRRLAEQAERDTSLRSKQPWKAAWEKDFNYVAGAEKALQAAVENNWTVVSMKRDFSQVFPFTTK